MANNVSIPLNVSDAAKEIFLELLKSNPEQLKALMEQAGRKDTDKVISDTQQAVIVAQEKDALDKFKTDLSKDLIDFGNALHDSGEILAGIDRAEIRLYFTRSEYTLGTQVLQPGWHVIRFDAKTDIMSEMANLSKVGKSTGGGGNGGHRAVTLPDGITSWADHWKSTYPEDAKKYKGKIINATLRLKALNDATYLNALAANGTAEKPAAEKPAKTKK